MRNYWVYKEDEEELNLINIWSIPCALAYSCHSSRYHIYSHITSTQLLFKIEYCLYNKMIISDHASKLICDQSVGFCNNYIGSL